MIKWIKNTDIVSNTWQGKVFAVGEYYQIPINDEYQWDSDDIVLKAIHDGKATMAKDNSGLNDIVSLSDQWHYLSNIDVRIQKTQSTISQDVIKSRFLGNTFIAAAGQTTFHDTLIDFKYMRGGHIETLNHKFGDTVHIQIIDINNVLGFGAGALIDDYIKNMPLKNNGENEIKSIAISNAISPGLYCRTTYISTGTVNVNCGLTLYGFNDV